MPTDSSALPNSYDDNSGQDLSFTAWFMDENPHLEPSPLTLNMEQQPPYADGPNHQLDPGINPDDPLSDPVLWAFFNGSDDTGGDPYPPLLPPSIQPEEGSSSGYPVHQMQGPDICVPSCFCCQTLREITHFNGINVKRLEIHGRFGIISHAVLAKYEFDSSMTSHENQVIDFSMKGMQSVKKFMVQYFDSCIEEGYFLLDDPLSPFYEALSVGLSESNGSDDYLLSSPDHTGSNWMSFSTTGDDYMHKPQDKSKQTEDAAVSGSRVCNKIPLAKQRERTRNLKMKDLKDYFDLPMEDAARKMNVCPTVIKKICRKSGMERWPHRKIKSIEGKISKKLKKLYSNDAEEREQARADIDKYKQELTKIYQQFSK